MRKIHWFILLILLAFPVAGMLFYPSISDQMATHWSGGDAPDGFMGKFAGTFVIAAILMIIIAVQLAINIGLGKVYGSHHGIQKVNLFLDYFLVSLSLFLLCNYLAVLAWNTGLEFSLPKFMLISGSVLTILILVMTICVFTRKSGVPPQVIEAKSEYIPSTGEYKDHLVEITHDTITFKEYYFPVGSKTVAFSQIQYVEDKPPTLRNGKYRYHGTGDLLFRIWFPADYDRSGRDRIFVMKLKGKWVKIGFTAEDSAAVAGLFRARGLMR